MKTSLLLLASAAILQATPIPLINPSIEINNNVDGTLASDASILGWDGDGALSEGGIDYGNGRWKLRFEDSESVRQLSTHQIETGASYSIRFDAATSSITTSEPDHIIVGGTRLNGNFNADTSGVDSRTFADTPDWHNLTGNQGQQATRLTGATPSFDGTRNAVVSDSGAKEFSLDTNYDLTTGEALHVSYQWRDASTWDDASDQIRTTIFTTDDNSITGTRTDIESLLSGTSTANNTYEAFAGSFAPIPISANGKRLFVVFEGIDGNASTGGFARLDNFVLQQFNSLLIGPYTRNGDFNDDVSAGDERSFDDTPFWTNLSGPGSASATRTNIQFDTTRCAYLTESAGTTHGNDTDYVLATGDVLTLSFVWRDASNWDDASDRVAAFIFTTNDDTITGTQTILETLYAPLSSINSTFEPFSANFSAIPGSANGKRLFFGIRPDDGNATTNGFGRVENILLSVNDTNPTIPPAPPASPTATVIAEAYVDNGGTPQVIDSQTFTLLSQSSNQWNHYHYAIPAATLDAFAGQEIGIQFRGPDASDDLYQSVDNVRFDHYPSTSPDGSFSTNWDSSPNRVWPGPGYWANRLQDWQVNNGRVNCILTTKERRTVHRVGTSIRGNGENFSLSLRTGLHAGTNNSSARTGLLIGAGPNLEWRGSLLVHDGLGRDFGTFLGINNNGAAVIEDYSEGATNQVSIGANPPGGFPADARLELSANYNGTTKDYDLTLEVYDPGNTLLSTASTSVSSDRVLGSFGFLSHRGSNNARFWFDDFSGSGGALQPEPDRHLAIIGALHSLNWGVLKMSAQLPAISLAGNPMVTLDTWNGATWTQIATAPVDNTDNLSSFNAIFEIDPWDDTLDTPYRLGVTVDGSTYYYEGTVRHNPVEKNEIVVANTSCQRLSDGSLENNGRDWTPKDIWHPHLLAYGHVAKHDPDVFLALGDQIYEGQPTSKDTSSEFRRHHDYLYKWILWMLQTRDLTKDIPTISIPDDHDIYQGNLWGEGGKSTGNQNTGGYTQPASWVRLVERTQTSHFPAPDPYNPTQPAPTVDQGIKVYFTGMNYGEIGFGVLEDRKFKTGKDSPPADLNDQFILGQRQKDFLQSWSTDWVGQRVKCIVSQSPFGMLHTHGSAGYNFNLNDRDTNGWPPHRREDAWELFRLSRSFQLAGDQHISTLVHHGIDDPADAGYSFTSAAISNFFPRVWDPVHNSGGTTNTVSPYKGDFYLDGSGNLPSGEPNLTSDFPGHIRVVAVENPLEYYNQTRNIHPANLHDRGAGYGIIRIDKTTRQITFESWPVHADPEFPQTGSQFPDWPVTINQTDNDGRVPTGFLSVIDTLSEKTPVVSVYDEATGDLVYSMRFPGNLVRPPVYDNGTTYRVEISYGDDPVSEIRTTQSASPTGAPVIHSFTALHPSIITGESTTLQWNVETLSTLTIDNGGGDVSSHTINGIGHLLVSPTTDTTYTLTLNGTMTAQATVLVFPTKTSWLNTHFTAGELLIPTTSGDLADPDGDGFTNEQEFLFQTDPRDASSVPTLVSDIVVASGIATVDFSSAFPLESDQCTLRVDVSSDLQNWTTLPSNSYQEIDRNNSPTEGTTQITIRLTEAAAAPKRFYRATWVFN